MKMLVSEAWCLNAARAEGDQEIGADSLKHPLRLNAGPTERQLEWMRKNIPHFETCEKQARAARGRQG